MSLEIEKSPEREIREKEIDRENSRYILSWILDKQMHGNPPNPDFVFKRMPKMIRHND